MSYLGIAGQARNDALTMVFSVIAGLTRNLLSNQNTTAINFHYLVRKRGSLFGDSLFFWIVK